MCWSRSIRCWLAVVAVIIGGTTACGSADQPAVLAPAQNPQDPAWGPLAVVDEPATGGATAGLGPGTLQITPECVTLRVDGVDRAITLVWRQAEVAWDRTTREIVFTRPGDPPVRLADGARIVVGGNERTPALPRWLVLPAQACPAARFTVHDVNQ